ncbi:limonene-1,2-epoxide hydrolase family protein [Nocardia pseudobrasiliensis]|uniref:Limonene-1,2-epoxide hydrolase n=1 Tax=Nocardia pseudobrasiliensis TaxID=45979 RepID=A0A370IE01_9NOCA|nr:limonene-1,2-epoxide hydrolase family protein [Nocardia pseudobrasiliensis]RDI68810.1 limonene-1,2-epoxide hydrolase [Nocardia pseudobrasiliensis]
MSTPGELVTAFCAEWGSGTPESIAEYFSDDAVYHNVPMAPLAGKPAILEFLHGFLGNFGNIDFTVHHQAEVGAMVLNERTDRFVIGDNKVELPVMGAFEVRDGKIVAWRDYFDMAPFNAMSAG